MTDKTETERIDALIRDGDLEAATRHLDAALKGDDGNPALLALRGRVLAATGDDDGAVKAFDAALERDGEHADALAYKGAVLLAQGHTDQAVPLLDQALKNAPTHGAAHFNRGRAYARAGQFQQADQHITAAMKAEPDNAYYTFAKARILMDRDKFEESFDMLVKTVKQNPTLVEAWLVLTDLQRRSGQPQECYDNLKTAMTHNPGEPRLLDAFVSAALATGHIDEATRTAEDLCAMMPDNDECVVNLGLCQLSAEDFAAAEKSFRRALGMREKNPRALHSLGMLLEVVDAEGALDEAEELFKKAIACDPAFWKAYNDLALIYVTRQEKIDLDQGRSLLEKAVTLADGAAPEPLLNLALAEAKLGNLTAAKTLCDQARTHPLAHDDIKEQARGLLAELD